MSEEKRQTFQLDDVLQTPIRIYERLFQYVKQEAENAKGIKNFNYFIQNPEEQERTISYQYDPDFLFGMDTSYTKAWMEKTLIGSRGTSILQSPIALEEYVERNYNDGFHNRYAYRENEKGIHYLELNDELGKALFKRCLLNYANHFYLTFTFSEDDQSQQLENDKIIEILKAGDGIYLPYTKEMFDAIDLDPLLMDRELFLYEDGFIYLGDNAHQVYDTLVNDLPDLKPVENYGLSYEGKLNEAVLKKLYALQKEVIVSESWILIHGRLSDTTLRALDNYGVTFTLQEEGTILLRVDDTNGIPIMQLYPMLEAAYENGISYYRSVSDNLYNGALARLGHIEVKANHMQLLLGKTSFATHIGLKDPRLSLYPTWSNSFFNEEESELLQQMDQTEELLAQALVVRLGSEDTEQENYYLRRVDAINDYLARSMSIHRVSIAGNLVTRDGYLLYERKDGYTGVSVYGAAEIYDEAVTYYHNTSDAMVPSIYHNFDLYRNFNRELSRHVLLKHHIQVNDLDWHYAGIAINGYAGQATMHTTPLQFHVIASHPIQESMKEMAQRNAKLHGLSYELEETDFLSLLQSFGKKFGPLLLAILLLILSATSIWSLILEETPVTFLKLSVGLMSSLIFLFAGAMMLYFIQDIIANRKIRAYTTKHYVKSSSLQFETLQKEDTMLTLLQNLYFLEVLQQSSQGQKHHREVTNKKEVELYQKWKQKVTTNKRSARKNTTIR